MTRNEDGEKDTYLIADGDFHAKGFKLLWIRSCSKMLLDSQSRLDRLQKTSNALNALTLKLNKRGLKEGPSIKAKIEEIIKAHQCEGLIEYSLNAEISGVCTLQAAGEAAAELAAEAG
jgi:hypothetical protein